MTPRSIRRAAERKAVKQARKAQQNPPVGAPADTPANQPAATPVSAAKLAANRANAKLSCGPTSETGKLISSKNALKTGLTGRTVLLPTDDVAAYDMLLNRFLTDFPPATLEERVLLQSMVDTTWRLNRIMNLEFAIYTKGSIEFADQFDDLEPSIRAQMIQVETFLKYEKSIRNLNTQEARLQRWLVKDTIELKRLQAERLQQEAEVNAFPAARSSKALKQPTLSEVGFEFSNDIVSCEYTDSTPQTATATAMTSE